MADQRFLVCASVLLLSLFPLTKSLDYKDALSKTILYFELQRSGHLPFNQRATWRDHSGLTDGLEQGVDLVGGYHDAGDNIKFGLPMAFTVTMLSWSVLEYHEEIAAAGELQHALEAIKWGTDYFIKAHTHPHVLWVQVGDGGTDHQRPEDMTTSRRAYKIDEKHPGSDVAGETAAAMAAASIVFRTTNPHYSHLLLHHAKQVFEFGDKFRGKYDDDLINVKGFYPSVSGYKDELLWAGLWLYKATRKMEYMDYVIQNAHSFGGITWAMQEFSWDVKYAGVQIMASMLHRDEHKKTLYKYREKAEHYICSCLNTTKHTPGGLLFTRKWNNLQYVTNAAFLLTVYSDHLKSTNQNIICHNKVIIGADDVFNFAKSQVDYILGLNPMNMSYLVGYGTKYPKRVHHRGASIISYKSNKAFIGCMQGYRGWFGRRKANPNVLTGAVVGGPDDHDRFRDVRANYMQTEACTYNAAPLLGTLGKLVGSGGSVRRQ
ncbi:endoglucanase 11-like [Bidens hawaiensis]|uniref:endoglucanase 11-like n=1 Tax=Bidens hawaiensis TaxID=980011 RepID=UPI0040499C5B